MSFRNKSEFFRPIAEGQDGKTSSKPLVAVSGVYIVNKERVLRIVVGAADIYVQFAKIRTDLAAAIDGTNGILLPKDSVVYVSSGEFEYMKASGALSNVLVTADRG